MDAIDQMFAEFELVYHNQYNKAFPTREKLMYAKKLWFSHLASESPDTILRAARRAVRESEFLPTVKKILDFCQPSAEDLGLPDAHSAYLEACRAPSPKAEQPWSHVAVYHAGRESDWFFLANNPEHTAFPVFRRHYEQLCQRVLQGDELPPPSLAALPEQSSTQLSLDERREQLRKLRRELDI